MVFTAREMYDAFLSGIKKEQTSTVIPAAFNIIVNEALEEWVREKQTMIEFDQKKIDDLQVLRSVTDGVHVYVDASLTPPVSTLLKPIGPDTLNGKIFTLPVDPSVVISNFPGGGTLSTQHYPRYLRLLNVIFKIKYQGNTCYTNDTVSEWLGAKNLYSDRRIEIFKSPFRRPKDSKLYYEIVGNKIRLETGTPSYGHLLRLEYLRWPVKIQFVPPPGVSINSDLLPAQQREIVDITVRTYIERSKNPRYQTILQEQVIKGQSK